MFSIPPDDFRDDQDQPAIDQWLTDGGALSPDD